MPKLPNSFKEEVKPCALDVSEIEGFVADAKSDLNTAKKNKFILVIDLPICFDKLADDGSGRKCKHFKTRKLQMNVFGNIVPSVEVPKIDVPHAGQVMKVSSHARPTYPPVTVNFTVDSYYENYYVIYKWMDILNNQLEGGFDSNNEIGARGKLGNYSATFSLYGLGAYNHPEVRWDFLGCFPTSLGAINFNKRDPEELESEFTFDFTFLKMSLL